jgi:alpha-L-arabinofuranosidase
VANSGFDGIVLETGETYLLSLYARRRPHLASLHPDASSAKKSGREGFLILSRSATADAPTWWNIGGWQNTAHAIQGGDYAERRIPGKIESDRWYDIRVEVSGPKVKAFLDDEPVQATEIEPTPSLFAAAGRDERAQELVLTLVNPGAAPCPVRVHLTGFAVESAYGRLLTLAYDNPAAENSLDRPDVVVLQESIRSGIRQQFDHTISANAVQVLRVPLHDG